MINSNNINYFCENYTYSIIPCLANEMKHQAGATHHERFLIFRKCVENDRLKQNDTQYTINMIKILRLYLYSCIYSSMIDMSQSSCFNKLVQNCVEKNPTTRKCYYWRCKSRDFLTLKKSNIDLAVEDEENEDEENSNKAIVNRIGNWKTSNLEITSVSIIKNGCYQAINLNFLIYLADIFLSLFLSYTFI
ncbi:ADP-ribosylation factor-binding protein [Dirofilaria immitis]